MDDPLEIEDKNGVVMGEWWGERENLHFQKDSVISIGKNAISRVYKVF
jgi:hypothetical protein